ncbi:MAG TPA: ABC transporter ATP-binding protein [Chthoniobacterales bacterium]|nr:ABC transporter ATP-binding protein [Chthoniobacterales bacterium]
MAAITLKALSATGLPGRFDLTIQDREFAVLTGADESPGSAIVRMIAGLDPVSAGEILLGPRPVHGLPPSERGVGFVAQDFVPYPALTVSENISLGLEMRKFGKAEAERRTQEAAEMLDLQSILKTNARDLPAEQRQRIGLARAYAQQPGVYLFDQPFAGLPAEAQRRGRAEIAKLRDRSAATILYATGDPAEALAFGGRVVFMAGGEVQQDTDTRALLESPANLTVAKFFQDPPMNLIKGTVKAGRDGLLFSEEGDGTISVRLPPALAAEVSGTDGRSMFLGLTADGLTLAQPGRSKDTSFRALVDRIELKGTQSDIYLQTGAHNLLCRIDFWPEMEEGGRRREFDIDLAKVQLFDAASGYRITAKT